MRRSVSERETAIVVVGSTTRSAIGVVPRGAEVVGDEESVEARARA
jgi:hypothetical protein